MKEFAFLNENFDDLILNDNIEILNQTSQNSYIVANSKKLKAEIYAPEIDFYIKNTDENALEISKNVSLIYEIKAQIFDSGKDLDFQKDVGKNIVYISQNFSENLCKILEENGFKILKFNPNEILEIYGEIGDLSVICKVNGEEVELQSDFVIGENLSQNFTRQSGCYEFFNEAEILEILNSKSPKYRYKSVITYEEKTCQYANRRSEHCAACAEVCPTTAILKNDDERKLEISQIDCINCGNCVSVCPSGSLEMAKIPQNSFAKISEFFKNKFAILLPENFNFSASVKLPQKSLILAFANLNFLSFNYLLTLLQESGSQVLIFNDKISQGFSENVEIINEIYERKYAKKGVFVAKNLDEFEKFALKLEKIENSQNIINEQNLSKRESFSKRLSWLVADENLGVINSGEKIRFGEISINEKNCTLCLSCVGACNTSALFADANENAIKYNASLCTTCGYCVASCAESETLSLNLSGISLQKSFFEYKILAKDELFKCIECGKEFATKKAVMRVSTLLRENFKNDPYKLKTLFCCADCKAKLMIELSIKEQNGL